MIQTKNVSVWEMKELKQKIKAYISQTKNGKLKLTLFMDEFEREYYLLERGKVPEGTIEIEIVG